jgi:phage portal protein BeeE
VANKSWFASSEKQPSATDLEIKGLKDKLEAIRGELMDRTDYDVKFYDVEPSGYSGMGQFELSGVETTVTPTMLLRLFSTEPWVYSAVMAIAETISGIPWGLKKRQIVKKTERNEMTGVDEVTEQEVWVPVTTGSLHRLFQYPNPHISRSTLLQYIMIDLMVTGDAYLYLHSKKDLSVFDDFDEDNDPESAFGRLRTQLAKDTFVEAMYRMPSNMMQPVPKAADEGFGLHGYALQSQDGVFGFLPSEIVHIKFPNPMSTWNGLSPLMAAILRILLDRYSTEHMMRFYKSGARLGGMIETEKNLNNEQITRLQRSFENNYTGRQNFYRTLVLPNGMRYKPVEQNPVESTVIELANNNREAILSVLRVPPIKVGILDHANYANANAQLKIFYDDTIRPRCAMLEDSFNMKRSLMPDNRSYRIGFDFSDISVLQEPFLDKATAAAQMLNAGLTPNEVRKKVWKAGPMKGGDKAKVIEDMERPDSPFMPFNLSAPNSGVSKEVGAAPVSPLAHLPRTVVTSIMNVVGRITRGKISPEAGAHLIEALGVPQEDACKLAGYTPVEKAPADEASVDRKEVDAVPPANQPALGADVKPTGATFEQRVAELTAQFIERDKLSLSVAIARAIEQAKQEGLSPETDPTPPSGGKATEEKPTLEEFMATALSTMDAEKDVTQDVIDKLFAMYEDSYGPITEEQRSGLTIQISQPEPEKAYAFGMSKDQVVDSWKTFLSKTDPLVEKRQAAVIQWFKKLRTAMKNELGANLKAYGLMKTRGKDDADEITNLKNYEKLLAEYIKEIDQTLDEAFKYGFTDTLVKFTFDVPNEQARKALQAYAAAKVKGIAETTMLQMREVITESFEQGNTIQDTAARIDEKFAEIETGRAMTIARTETLSAVSLGREAKREEFKEQFPESKLMKMWVSAQDERVRDSHQELDGKSVGVDEEFKEGLRFPRDPNGDAAEVINCRCTDITFVEEDLAAVESSLPAKDE